jgi:hypothetical protein
MQGPEAAAPVGGLPYELRAVEAVLVSVCNVLRDQYNLLSPRVRARPACRATHHDARADTLREPRRRS